MDNHIFRSAIGGFNRQDVMDYIEKAQKESAEQIAQLQQQLQELEQRLQELGGQLTDCEEERDDLSSRMEELTGRYDTAKANWESQAVTSENLRGDLAQRDGTIRELTAENQTLFHRVQDLEEELTALRLEKEKVAQLELEAHKRGEEVVAAARTRADEITAAAREEADEAVRQAREWAAELRHETAEQLRGAVAQYHELVNAFGGIASHVSAELRKMDVTAAQLPICFDHTGSGLDTVLEKICGE